MRAFIFSLDAFVAFTLALVAIYSLIFFSSIPSSYYYLLTQGHYLAKDTLYAASASSCDPALFLCTIKQGTMLDNIVFAKGQTPADQQNNIAHSVGDAIPKQFGYILEVSTDNGATLSAIYDTAGGTKIVGDQHATSQRKLSVSSQVLVFQNPVGSAKNDPNPFVYRTCGPNSGGGSSGFPATCAGGNINPPSGAGESADNLVPRAGFRLVRLTIFI
jgi:hypothetical protein